MMTVMHLYHVALGTGLLRILFSVVEQKLERRVKTYCFCIFINTVLFSLSGL